MLWRDVTPFPHQRVVLENDAIRHSGGRCADQKQQSEAGVRASANFRKTEPMYREQINTRPCSPTVVAPLHETRRASSKSGSDRWPGARPTRGHLRCRPAEGRRKHSPGFAAIRRSQNRSAITAIHSRGKVNNIRINPADATGGAVTNKVIINRLTYAIHARIMRCNPPDTDALRNHGHKHHRRPALVHQDARRHRRHRCVRHRR